MKRRKKKKKANLSGFTGCIKQESSVGVSSVTGPGRCGTESCMLLKLIWIIVVPQAPGQCAGVQKSSLPAPVSSVQEEGFC